MRHRSCTIALICLAWIIPTSPAEEWKAGIASVVITPEENVWMAGYAGRNKPAEGKLQELYAKAAAFEDEGGRRVVIVTLDLVGIPRWLRDHVEKECGTKYKLDPSSLMLNVSHTHCGPVVWSGGSVSYDLSEEEIKKLNRYVEGLREKLVAVVGKAIDDLKPARLGYSHARAGFAMNRRLPTETEPRNSPYPDGPVDHAVPVLRVEDPEGKLRAVLFGYACHNTTLSIYQFNGDYAGYAQEYLEEAHPGVKALFVMGCGGDQNPYPRGKVEQAQQHGRALANAVEAALLPKAKPVRGPLRTALEDVTLQFVPLDRDQLLKMKESTVKYDRKRGTYLLGELEKTGKLTSTYAYPVQVIRFGEDLTMVALGGEVVVDYSLRLKRELTGGPLWVAGYSNDVFGYVPSVRVLKEGGYEGGGAMRYTRFPGVFAPSVEETIVKKVHALVEQTRKQAP